MKKTMYFWLMALLIGGLSMAVTSCKDDDKDKNGGSGGGSGEEPALTPSETVVAKDAYTWLNILTDLEELGYYWVCVRPPFGKGSDQGYWVIRMKKSKDLCGSSTDKYHNMTNVKETYLYNKDV